jgi:nitrogen fixation negative regulator NifL
MRPEKKQSFLLFLILISVGFAIGFISIHGLFKTALKEEENHLKIIVKSWARLIEAIAEFDQKYSMNFPKGTTAATINQIRKAHEKIKNFGKTGEFVLARLENDKIVFILKKSPLAADNLPLMSLATPFAEPMKLALKGQSGTIIGLDYRGKEVMAAYEPIAILNLGLVAKIDLSEIREPFVKAGWTAAAVGLGIILIGSFLFLRISESLIKSLIKLNVELDESKNQYADLYDNAPDMFVSVSAETAEIVQCNQTLVDKTGYKKNEIIGMNIFKIYQPSCISKVETAFNNFVTKGYVENEELILRRKDGTSIPVILNVSSVKDKQGKPLYSRSAWRDITDLKEAENKLKVSEERLQYAVSGSQDGMWDWRDVNKEEVWWSPQVYYLLGYEDLEIKSTISQFNKMLHPDDLEKTEEALQDNFNNKVPYDIEYRLKTKTKDYRWFRARGQTVWNENDQAMRMSGSICDIHINKLTEISLQQSEERLREIIENMPILISALDQNWNVIVWNKKCEEVTGFKREEMVNNSKVAEILFPDKAYREQIILDWKNEGKNIEGRIVKITNKNKIVKTISWTNISDKVPIDGWALWGIGFDVTEKIKLNETIHKLSRAVEQSPVSIEITDKEGNIEYVNPYACMTTGYNAEELIGKNPSILKSGLQTEKFYKELWTAITYGKEWRGEFQNKKKNGELFWEWATISPIKNDKGEITHFLAVKEDITQRKQIEKELLESEWKFRSLVKNIPGAVFRCSNDEHWTMEFLSAGIYPICGYTSRELIGNHVNSFNSIIDPKDRNNVREEIEKAIKRKQPYSIEYKIINKNGSIHHVLEKGRAIFDEDENIQYIDGSIHDISEIKTATEKLQLAQKQLMESEKLAGIGQLAAGVSHEVLNPLNIISIHVQMLLRKTIDNESLKNSLEKMQFEIKRIEKILKTLLVFSRKSDAELEQVEIEMEIDSALGLIEKDFELENIEIIRDFSRKLPNAFIDKDKMRQVFLNLISNSKHAMQSGGKFTVKTELKEKDGTDLIVIYFKDTGSGIKPEHNDKIFEPFFTTKTEGKGTGIGLSISHAIIEKFGGTITFESEEGKGTTFIIELPIINKK